eukprot:COSAG05_NODE_55_length_23493_cov_709.337907_23_plen_103_part_00
MHKKGGVGDALKKTRKRKGYVAFARRLPAAAGTTAVRMLTTCFVRVSQRRQGQADLRRIRGGAQEEARPVGSGPRHCAREGFTVRLHAVCLLEVKGGGCQLL